MNLLSLPEHTSTSPSLPPISDTRLSGTRLLIARGIWLVLILLFCGFYIGAVLVYAVQLHGFREGVYVQLISTPTVVSGYDAITSLYLLSASSFTILMLTLLSPCWLAVSLLIFWCRSDDWMALFTSLFLMMLATNLSPAFLALSHIVGFFSLVGISITLLHLLAWSSIIFFFALFPDGRFIPGWTGWLAPVYLLWQVSFCLPSNVSFSIAQWPPLLVASLFLFLVLTCAFAQIYRYRFVSTAIQQQQTKWVVFGMLLGTLVDAANLLPLLVFPTLTQASATHTLYAVLSAVTFPIIFLLIPFTVGVAVLRHHLWNIDLLINRALVYGLLSISIIGLSVLVIVGLGTLFSMLGNLLISLFATALIAVLVQPLRQRLQQAINHLMFGESDDPYRILSRLSRCLEATLTTDALVPTTTETVAQALKLPYVAITSRQQQQDILVASTGKAHGQAALVRVPLVVQTEQIGELLLAARSPDVALTPADLRLLHDLAPQIAVAVQTVRLTTELKHLTRDLQQSRTRLITAREEERRRLRRDLHDSLGPTLASLTFKIDAVRNLLSQESERADQLLVEVRGQIQEAIADIRRLVYNLRPPALDELGLLSALKEQGVQYHHRGLQIVVDIPDSLPPLPAAVEVAAYRIAQEALTNVIRHAEAQQCLLHLRLHDNALILQITDNGKGIPAEHRIGVGLLAMRERAVELEGSCTIIQGTPSGTTIQVSLPLNLTEDDTSPLP